VLGQFDRQPPRQSVDRRLRDAVQPPSAGASIGGLAGVINDVPFDPVFDHVFRDEFRGVELRTDVHVHREVPILQ